MKNSNETASTEELKSKLQKIRTIQVTILIIFAFIILVWLILGYWRNNIAIFIVTVSSGITTTAALIASTSGITAEIKKRESTEQKTESQTPG
ncbi:MAG: hypothetical protein R3B84_01030 [Zavarzinella sp.]